jgi:ribonuclease P protein component
VYTLGKNERLKSRKSIELLFAEGKKINISPFRVLYIIETGSKQPSLSFAAGVSTRNFKKAVDRNRVKRLTREAYRLQKKSLQQKIEEQKLRVDVFFIYTGKELPSYDLVYEKMGAVLFKLDKLVTT